MRTKEEIYKKIDEIEFDIKNIDCKLSKEYDYEMKMYLYQEKSNKQATVICLYWVLGAVISYETKIR